MRTIATALWSLLAALTVIAISDIISTRLEFPSWFPWLFGWGALNFVGCTAWLLRRALARYGQRSFRSDRHSSLAWLVMSISWISTTAVHQFFPFWPDVMGTVKG